MNEDHTNMASSLDSTSNSSTNGEKEVVPPFGAGAIVLTPTNFICRVVWVKLMAEVPVASVEYLEMHSSYSVFPIAELKLLAQGAKRPYFDEVCAQKHSYEREQYLNEQMQIEEHVRRKGVTKEKPNRAESNIVKMLSKLSPEQLAKILEELEK